MEVEMYWAGSMEEMINAHKVLKEKAEGKIKGKVVPVFN
jgi:hypothetical protein